MYYNERDLNHFEAVTVQMRSEVGHGQGVVVRNVSVNNIDLIYIKGQYFSSEIDSWLKFSNGINVSTRLRRQRQDWTTLW
jgi:hypothetical protein